MSTLPVFLLEPRGGPVLEEGVAALKPAHRG